CCGTTGKVLEKLAAMGSTALSVESHGDPQSIVDRVGDKVVLVGGVDPVRTLMQGTPEDVMESAWRAADAGYCLVTPECGVPPVTPNENLLALSKYRDA
ncbi:MAG: methylcobamide--CoM methyltransferase, partial [Candidatus Methanomethylophilaceae archaeon]|nr:methylcobamide--CoM methyltransferase [Candidatus Methanomethylophilaceae archaeon]